MQTKSRETVYKDIDIQFDIEFMGPESLLLHCIVEGEWTPSLYKRALRVFVRFMSDAYDHGYKELISFSPNPKFCKLFGARSMGEFEYENKTYEVMRWALN